MRTRTQAVVVDRLDDNKMRCMATRAGAARGRPRGTGAWVPADQQAQSSVQQPDPGPMERFREFIASPGAMGEIVQRLADADSPQTLKDIARALRIPYGKLCEWITADTERAQQYANALQFVAETYAHETVQIADDAGTDDDPAATKLKIQTRQWLAARLNRARYGEHSKVDVKVEDTRQLNRDEMLLEAARDLGFILASAEAVREGREVLALPAPSTGAEPAAGQEGVI